MFHSHDSWYWERLADGGVRVVQKCRRFTVGMEKPETLELQDHVLTAEAWASIVASVSARDETTETYHEALAFHSKEPSP